MLLRGGQGHLPGRRSTKRERRDLAFSPDGKVLAASSQQDGQICLLDMATGKEIARLDGPAGLKALAFSPDGKILATGIKAGEKTGRDLSVRLWDVSQQRDLCRVEAHRSGISALAFSPDGRRLLSASADATALVWDVAALIERKTVPGRRSCRAKESGGNEAQPPLQTADVCPKPSESPGKRGIGTYKPNPHRAYDPVVDKKTGAHDHETPTSVSTRTLYSSGRPNSLEGAAAQAATAAPMTPSYEELTTTYANGNAGNIVGVGTIHGTTQTEYRLTVPTGSNTTTTTESINLAGNAGLEKVVDVSTKQGNTTTENITTTLPDGTITTKTETQVTDGRKTKINASLNMPGVGIQTTSRHHHSERPEDDHHRDDPHRRRQGLSLPPSRHPIQSARIQREQHDHRTQWRGHQRG